jgi:uroporphyrinogen-III synthase
MAYLLTYPQANVPVALQQQLAPFQPVYYPLRQLTPRPLTAAEQRLIRTSECLVLTSPFGIQCYLQQLKSLNPTAALAVLSPKMAHRLRQAEVSVPIKVAPAAQQRQLYQYLRQQIPTQRVCWLQGDHHPTQPLPPAWHQVTIYTNQWPKSAQQQAQVTFSTLQFQRILVTSPLNLRRLLVLKQALPNTFLNSQYYTLGPSTAKLGQQAGLTMVSPPVQQNVLAQMIQLMVAGCTSR